MSVRAFVDLDNVQYILLDLFRVNLSDLTRLVLVFRLAVFTYAREGPALHSLPAP
jgi:hypothetical protein